MCEAAGRRRIRRARTTRTKTRPACELRVAPATRPPDRPAQLSACSSTPRPHWFAYQMRTCTQRLQVGIRGVSKRPSAPITPEPACSYASMSLMHSKRERPESKPVGGLDRRTHIKWDGGRDGGSTTVPSSLALACRRRCRRFSRSRDAHARSFSWRFEFTCPPRTVTASRLTAHPRPPEAPEAEA
ncbi:hypothetical protein BV20DRAFT_385524 [Pilatotrama ljubarskyi]|nr:hypothetical protein BV20DRAFT_385524 [Pilatotrama ljubarskyi]